MEMTLKKPMKLRHYNNPNKRKVVTAGTYRCETRQNPVKEKKEPWYVLSIGEVEVGTVASYFGRLIKKQTAIMGVDDP